MPRITKQKIALYNQIKQLTSFFNAYELQKNTKLGLATIYRFLNDAEKNGEIHSFVCNNKKIYSNNKTSHTHFTCEKCNKTKHITIKNVDFLKEINDDVCHFQIDAVGICEECRGREN